MWGEQEGVTVTEGRHKGDLPRVVAVEKEGSNWFLGGMGWGGRRCDLELTTQEDTVKIGIWHKRVESFEDETKPLSSALLFIFNCNKTFLKGRNTNSWMF